jgi:hypothetical protein
VRIVLNIVNPPIMVSKVRYIFAIWKGLYLGKSWIVCLRKVYFQRFFNSVCNNLGLDNRIVVHGFWDSTKMC